MEKRINSQQTILAGEDGLSETLDSLLGGI